MREDFWGLAAEGEPVEHARCAEEERVACGESGGEDAGVDDVREDLDACTGHGDHVGRLGGVSGALKQGLVVGGHDHASD